MYAMLRYTILYYTILYHATLYYILCYILCSKVYYATLYYTILYILRYTTSNHTVHVLYHTDVLYCTLLYCIYYSIPYTILTLLYTILSIQRHAMRDVSNRTETSFKVTTRDIVCDHELQRIGDRGLGTTGTG
jgi:hypothetical protein